MVCALYSQPCICVGRMCLAFCQLAGTLVTHDHVTTNQLCMPGALVTQRRQALIQKGLCMGTWPQMATTRHTAALPTLSTTNQRRASVKGLQVSLQQLLLLAALLLALAWPPWAGCIRCCCSVCASTSTSGSRLFRACSILRHTTTLRSQQNTRQDTRQLVRHMINCMFVFLPLQAFLNRTHHHVYTHMLSHTNAQSFVGGQSWSVISCRNLSLQSCSLGRQQVKLYSSSQLLPPTQNNTYQSHTTHMPNSRQTTSLLVPSKYLV